LPVTLVVLAVVLLVLVIAPLSGAARVFARAPGTPGRSSSELAALLGSSRQTIAAQQAAVVAVSAQPAPPNAFDAARQSMQQAALVERYRATIRDEQVAIYQLAGSSALRAQVEARLGSRTPPGLDDAIAGLHALWMLLGVRDPSRVTPEASHDVNGAEPAGTLLAYDQEAAARNGIGWGYLAAINYIESDDGRNNGPSPAGAEGPMQFLPSTWSQYGGGGNIQDPHDAIFAAAGYLRLMGAPGDYGLAVGRYDNDANYVQAVTHFAAAMGADPLWFYRLYYWNTYG
jgi:hypothetical protein